MFFCVYHEWVEFCQIYFASVDIMSFFFFILLMWWIALIDFKIFNQPCITRINPTWQWYVIYIYCWILFVNILHIFMRDSVVLFFCTIFGFVIKVILAYNELEIFPPLLYSGRDYKFLVKFFTETIWAWRDFFEL